MKKEYDWHKERQKYKSGKTPAEPQSQPQPQTQTPAPRPVPAELLAPKKSPAGIIILISVIVLLLIGGGVALALLLGKEKQNTENIGTAPVIERDSAVMLSRAAEEYKEAVGVVTLRFEFKNGKKLVVPIGTAWAFAPGKFATNGHVAKALQEGIVQMKKELVQVLLAEEIKKNECKNFDELVQKLGAAKVDSLIQVLTSTVNNSIARIECHIAVNGVTRKTYTVTHVQIHKEYGVIGTDFDPDVAVLTIKETSPVYFKIADTRRLYALKSGEPVAFLGFPSENLNKDNLNLDSPVASMQSGIIVAVSDFSMKDAGADGNYLIRHNLPATGGASGSPIFNRDGEVVALLYAGNVVGQLQPNGKVGRAPSAAQINFGVRSDLLSGMGEAVTIQMFLK